MKFAGPVLQLENTLRALDGSLPAIGSHNAVTGMLASVFLGLSRQCDTSKTHGNNKQALRNEGRGTGEMAHQLKALASL